MALQSQISYAAHYLISDAFGLEMTIYLRVRAIVAGICYTYFI